MRTRRLAKLFSLSKVEAVLIGYYDEQTLWDQESRQTVFINIRCESVLSICEFIKRLAWPSLLV